MEWRIEISEHLFPVEFPVCYRIELRLDMCCETILHELREFLFEIVRNDKCDIRGDEFLRLYDDITSILYRLYRRRVGRWSPDSLTFELLHECCFCISWWWESEFLLTREGMRSDYFSLLQEREFASFFILFIIISLDIELHKSWKYDHFPFRYPLFIMIFWCESIRRRLDNSLSHLRCDCPLPYELIEFHFLGIES